MKRHNALTPSLDDFFAAPAWLGEVGVDQRKELERFVNEQGPRLQRLAWAFDNFGDGPLDEAEFADVPFPGHYTGQTLREMRASSRWMWIVDLAHEAVKIKLWAECPSWHRWYFDEDGSAPWGMHAPTLKDVLGASIILALLRWQDHERLQARKLIEFALARLDAIAAKLTAAGVLALVLTRLIHSLASLHASLDRLVEPLIKRVQAPGGCLGFALRI